MAAETFDVVIAGGGLAGSALAGVLAKSGLGVLVVEKESRFRDRIRGELTWPWGYYEALRVGLGEPLEKVGVVPLPVLDFYQNGQRVESQRWAEISINALPCPTCTGTTRSAGPPPPQPPWVGSSRAPTRVASISG